MPKRITLPPQPEKDLQESIVELLTLEGATVLQFAKIGARPRCPKCGTCVGSIITQEKSLPDILAIFLWQTGPKWTTQHIWFECKKVGEKPNVDQQKMHKRLRDSGDTAYAVESLEEAQTALRLEGFTLRTEAK